MSRIPLVFALLVACAPASEPAPALPGLRGFADPAAARPPYCVVGTNCLRIDVNCNEPSPDGTGGAWCPRIGETDNEEYRLAHVTNAGVVDVDEVMGRLANPRLAVGPNGAVAVTGISIHNVEFAGHTAGGSSYGTGYVGVRRADGTGWLVGLPSSAPHLRFTPSDLAFLPDGRVLVVGGCAGDWTEPVTLDCRVGGAPLLEFAADGTSVTRRDRTWNADHGEPTRVTVGPDGATYVLTRTALVRVDGNGWAFTFDLSPPTQSIGLLRDGRVWVVIGGLRILSADGAVLHAEDPGSVRGASPISGLAELPDGELVGWVGAHSAGGGTAGAQVFGDASLVQRLANGRWRGVRPVRAQAPGDVWVKSDAQGHLFLWGLKLPEAPDAWFVRVDPP